MKDKFFDFSFFILLAFFLNVFSIGNSVVCYGDKIQHNSNIQIGQPELDWSVTFYNQFIKDSHKNIVFSPFSLSLVMSMLYVGAAGDTAAELKALFFNQDVKDLKAIKELVLIRSFLNNNDLVSSNLIISNAFVAEPRFVPSSDYKTFIQHYFEADFLALDLAGINHWVSEKTAGKIATILNQLDPLSKLVLINAIYFQGKWMNGFDVNKTGSMAFQVREDDFVDVKMMQQTAHFKVLNKVNFQIIELPYEGNEFSFIILLPRKFDDFHTLKEQLLVKNIDSLFRELDQQVARNIRLFLPKFSLEANYNLRDVFENVGINSLFSNPDFSNLTKEKGVFVSQIVHKSMLEINEKGTVAAASTGVEMAKRSARIDPVFKVNKPFVFFLRHKSLDTTLFMGHVVNPLMGL